MLEDLLLFIGLLGLVISIGMRVSLRKNGTKNTAGKESNGLPRSDQR